MVKSQQARHTGMNIRMLPDPCADYEKGCACLVLAQEVEHEGSPARRTVVEGQGDVQTARTKSPAAAFSLIARSSPFTRTVSCSAAG